jgi:glutathione peroxidase
MLPIALAASLWTATGFAADEVKDTKPMSDALSFKMTGIDGKELDLSTYRGKVVLIVNVASRCGYTPQYEGLQKLYAEHNKAGLVVLGVPANDFGKQEPGTNEEIAKFCVTNYKVTFPLTAKVTVKGSNKAPLFQYLTDKETNPKFGGEIGWNFEKFLIGKDGKVAGRFKSGVEPTSEEMVKAIKAEIEKK